MRRIKKSLMKGNHAVGLAAINAGCDAYFGYPITPQNELTAYMASNMERLGKVFVQSESEISAINMVFGAAVTGSRAMTSSSSPGISLKQEGISYLCGCELPAVVVNIQRGGPGLGNIAGSQADYFQATRGGGHGDYRTIVLAPGSVQEMYDLTFSAFDLAEKYRNPVLILSDGVLGQMLEPVKIRSSAKKRINKKKDWILDGCRGRSPRFIKSLMLQDGELEKHNWHLSRKYAKMEKEARYESSQTRDADLVLVAFGISSRVCRSSMVLARKQGYKVGLYRPISLWPFPKDGIRDLASSGKKFLVVEMNLGQMVEDVRLYSEGMGNVYLHARPGGGLPDAGEILTRIKQILGRRKG